MSADGDSSSLLQNISSSVVAVTRTANQLASEDIDFHRGLTPSFGEKLDRQNARLLALTERLLGNAAAGPEVVRPRLQDVDAIDNNWRGIVDVLDSLLERADTSLDEFSGAVKRLSPGRDQIPSSPRPSKIAAALRSQDLVKPQLSFEHALTNKEKGVFVPHLQSKPHAIIPLDQSLTVYEGEDGLEHMSHPYQSEIEQYEYPSSVYTRAEPVPYHPFDTTTATFVDTEEAVEEMLKELKQAKEIAIDMEHHDQRSYVGRVCLMQISTRNRDWIVDTLIPWRWKLQALNEVFADPSILKVLHGAHMDIIWLQRDLGLYIVGLFDTFHAAKVLGYPGKSLAFLLKKFIDFDAQKQYQTADWRIRPLPQEMFDYARSDTHFLLYIYDNMRNELVDRSSFAVPDREQDKIYTVLKESKGVALQTYDHPVYDPGRGLGPGGWYKMLLKNPSMMSKEQFCIFRDVHEWRDQVAREQDDSIHYVLANHQIFSIAKEMPTEKAKLFSVAQPLTQTVRHRVDELLAVIARAKAKAEHAQEMREKLKEIEVHLYGESAPEVLPYQPTTQPAITSTISDQVSPSTAPLSMPQTPLSALRANVSSFWGKTLSPNQQHRKASTLQPQLIIPLPFLTAEIFTTHTTHATSTPKPIHTATPNGTSPPSATATPAPSSATRIPKDENEIFTLRGASKRKADALSTPTTPAAAADGNGDGLAGQNDEISINGPADDDGSQSAERKRAKRERKKAKQAAKAAALRSGGEDGGMVVDGAEGMDGVDGEEADGDGDGEVQPFDYSTAPSVLNAAKGLGEGREKGRRGKDGREKGGKDKNEPFSFAKGLGDVGKGLGRRQKEKKGLSRTFKS